MFCRPASSSRATNGVVFQTSASMTGTQASAVLDEPDRAASCTRPRSTSSAFAIPAWPSNMKRQSSADTTVGMAQGTRTAARTSGAAAEGAVHGQRQDAAEPELEGDAGDGEEQRVRRGPPGSGRRRGPRA